MDEADQYQNQVAWDCAVSRLVERMQHMGELLSPKESRVLTDRLYHIAIDLTAKTETSEKRQTLDDRLEWAVSGLPENELFTSADIVEKLNYRFSSSRIWNGLKRMQNKGKTIISMNFDKPYWFRYVQAAKGINLPTSAPSCDIPHYAENREWMLFCLSKQGYCESPQFLNQGSLHNRYQGRMHNMWYHIASHYHNKDRFQNEMLETKIGISLQRWVKDGQPVFDSFVQQTHLPTVSINGFPALVYQPESMKKIQAAQDIYK